MMFLTHTSTWKKSRTKLISWCGTDPCAFSRSKVFKVLRFFSDVPPPFSKPCVVLFRSFMSWRISFSPIHGFWTGVVLFPIMVKPAEALFVDDLTEDGHFVLHLAFEWVLQYKCQVTVQLLPNLWLICLWPLDVLSARLFLLPSILGCCHPLGGSPGDWCQVVLVGSDCLQQWDLWLNDCLFIHYIFSYICEIMW